MFDYYLSVFPPFLHFGFMLHLVTSYSKLLLNCILKYILSLNTQSITLTHAACRFLETLALPTGGAVFEVVNSGSLKLRSDAAL